MTTIMVSPIARLIGQQEAGDDPGQGRRDQHLQDGLGSGGAEAEGGVAQRTSAPPRSRPPTATRRTG